MKTSKKQSFFLAKALRKAAIGTAVLATFLNYGCINSQKSKNWIFISSSNPNFQYAVDANTAVKEIGFATYWKAKILSTPTSKGTSVYLAKMRALCGVDSRALLHMIAFDSSGNKTEEFVGASDFILTSPADESEIKVNAVACGSKTDGSVTEQLKTLASSPSKNPVIEKTIQNVLFVNKHIASKE